MACLLGITLFSCQDDTLEFERIDGFELQDAKIPASGNVGDSLRMRFSASGSLKASIEPYQGAGLFYLQGGELTGDAPLQSIMLGADNELVYIPATTGSHAGRIILENASQQRDTVDYQIEVTKRLPDYNARLYRDSTSGDFMLYLKQQGVEELDAVYNLQVKAGYDVEMILHVAGSSQEYRIGDNIKVDYRTIKESNYTVPIELSLISVQQERYTLNFEISDENKKAVSISKNLSYSKDNPNVPTEPEPIVLPDFNTRVFTTDSTSYNMYLKQQTANEDTTVNYTVYVEGGFNDDDIEMEIYFAGRQTLYRLGDIIKVDYAQFKNNNYLLPFELKVVEAAQETYRINFVVEDESGKKVTVTKEFEINTGS